jgi:hypothetical protein
MRNAHSSFILISNYLIYNTLYYTAATKMAIVRKGGSHVGDSPAEIGDTRLRVLSAK